MRYSVWLITAMVLAFITPVVGCTAPSSVALSPLSSEYDLITSYAFSNNNDFLALLLGIDYVPAEGGATIYHLNVLDQGNSEVVAQQEYFERAPSNLVWATDPMRLLYLMDVQGRNISQPRIVQWNPREGTLAEDPFPYTGFALGPAGDTLVAWGALAGSKQGELKADEQSTLFFYTFPELESRYEQVPVGDNEIILDAHWSTDGSQLLVLAETRSPEYRVKSIYELNVDSQTVATEIFSGLPPLSRTFAWSSEARMVAFSTYEGLCICDYSRNCNLAKTKLPASRPKWNESLEGFTFIESDDGSQIVGTNLEALLQSDNNSCFNPAP